MLRNRSVYGSDYLGVTNVYGPTLSALQGVEVSNFQKQILQNT